MVDNTLRHCCDAGYNPIWTEAENNRLYQKLVQKAIYLKFTTTI